MFSHFCTAHHRVSLDMTGHVLSLKIAHPHLIHGTFSPSNLTALRYNCADIAYHYIISPCLHSYTIMFGTMTLNDFGPIDGYIAPPIHA